ncbi:MAG TPA: pyrroloquinoline quinone biosynthesis peptide chaperone PqqD [Pararhizobium sp.]|nr:pyrroloquinoline quinone biosynthesis peptide chaperone PqqD [Pararhizobium sp.]
MTAAFSEASRPRLPKGVRTRFDETRELWLLLGPERTLELDEIGAAILEQVDGTRSLGAIIDILADRYAEPRDRVADDVRTFLNSLVERRMLDIDAS